MAQMDQMEPAEAIVNIIKTAIITSTVRIYYIYYLIRSNAADGQRTADG